NNGGVEAARRGSVTTVYYFYIPGQICGRKFNDLNGNGNDNGGTDPGLQGWTIHLNGTADTITAPNVTIPGGPISQQTQITGADGSYCFTNLAPGTYTVSEEVQTGWTQSFPAVPGTHTVTIGANGTATSGSLTGNDFGNFEETSVHGYKFNDINDNGVD